MKVIVNMVVDGNGVKIMVFIILILILVCLSLVKKDSRYPALIDLVNLNSSNAIFTTMRKVKNEFQKQRFLDGRKVFINFCI